MNEFENPLNMITWIFSGKMSSALARIATIPGNMLKASTDDLQKAGMGFFCESRIAIVHWGVGMSKD